jgi:hypothetical protein
MENKRGISEDEKGLINHVMRWGSDGYPVKHLGRGWTWNFRSIQGPPVVFRTKREAVTSFEAFHAVLLDAYAGRI